MSKKTVTMMHFSLSGHSNELINPMDEVSALPVPYSALATDLQF